MCSLPVVLCASLTAGLFPAPDVPKPDTTSRLSKLAAGLKPGEWAVLNKDGDDSGYGAQFTDSGIGGLYGYASKAGGLRPGAPARVRLRVRAPQHEHAEHYAAILKFSVYAADADKWTRFKSPQWYLDTGTKGGNSHGYRYQTVANGPFFRLSLGPPAR